MMKVKFNFMVLLIIFCFSFHLGNAQTISAPNNNPPQPVSTPMYLSISENVDSIQQETGVIELQEFLGYTRMAWSLVKLLANVAKSKFGNETPECFASRAIQWMATTSVVSLGVRLGNMIANAIITAGIIDDLYKLIFPGELKAANGEEEVNTTKHKEFYRLMLKEYEEAKRYAELEMIMDGIDIASSATELGLTLSEIYQYPPILCTPK